MAAGDPHPDAGPDLRHPVEPGEAAGRGRPSTSDGRGGQDEPGEAEGDELHGDELDAGAFSSWLVGMAAALDGDGGSDVPCGSCTACCTSSQFVHIGPDEADALAHIPRELLFPAPGRPKGHVVLGYDERGHCPMLVEGACTIYEHRPVTCRTYDCRVLPAAGLDADEDQPGIADRVRRWRFGHPTDADRVAHDAVRAAARVGRDDPEIRRLVGPRTTQLAVLAVEVHDLFVAVDPRTGALSPVEPDPVAVRVEVRRRRGTGPDSSATPAGRASTESPESPGSPGSPISSRASGRPTAG